MRKGKVSLAAILILWTSIWCCRSCKAATNSHSGSLPHISIFVNSSSPITNSSCWSGEQEQACQTLSLALQGVKQLSLKGEHPWLFLEPGYYTIQNNSQTSFSGPLIKDFGIVGSGVDLSVIQCSQNAGMEFTGVTNITFRNMTFKNCGAVRNTTSMRNHSRPMTFWQFKVSLYFLLCSNISITQVNINNTIGIAVFLYSTNGSNSFNFMNIFNSQININNGDYPAAGGLYIEFPYCRPGNCSTMGDGLGEANLASGVTGASYSITNCQFVGNIANATDPLQMTEAFILPRGIHHTSLGRGGGVSIIFKGQAARNRVVIDGCIFHQNRAIWGGGLFVEHQDNSSDNTVRISSSSFTHNDVLDGNCMQEVNQTIGTGGGGARVGFIFYGPDHVGGNSISFHQCNFTDNCAYFGGGLSFYTAREPTSSNATNSLAFADCTWTTNYAQLGGAVDLTLWHPSVKGSTVTVSFTGQTRFQSNNFKALIPGMIVTLGTLSINSIPTQFEGYVEFSYNYHTALAAITVPIYFTDGCVANFTGNNGRLGGAVFLEDSAFFQVGEGTTFIFKKNAAVLGGGAIYSTSKANHDFISSRNCFIRYHVFTTQPEEWKTSFFFDSNIARGRNNSIFATSTLPCLWGATYGPATTDSVNAFCWSNWTYVWNKEEMNCTDQIETAPARFNTSTHQVIPLEVYPGIPKQLPPSLDVFDDYGHAINDIVLVSSLHSGSHPSGNFTIKNNSRYISDHNITIMDDTRGRFMKVDLFTIGSRVLFTELNVDVLDCPTGYSLLSNTGEPGACQCNDSLSFNNIVRCHSHSTARLSYDSAWVGHYDGKIAYLVAGDTPFTVGSNNSQFMLLSENTSEVGTKLCGYFNRKGTLCGLCKEGFGPALNSDYHCIPCSAKDAKYKWVFYFLTELLPPTVLFLVIMLFNISLTSASVNAFIFFCQVYVPVFTIYRNGVYHEIIGKFYDTIYDIWNLNFFNSFKSFQYCLRPDIKTIHLIILDYVVAIYPLLLMGMLYGVVTLYNRSFRAVVFLCRPIHHCLARIRGPWNMNTSITHTLAAFLLLSFVKFTVTSFRIVAPSYLYNQSGAIVDVRVYYQGDMKLFRDVHIVYGSIAVLVLIVFVSFPTLLLLLFPFKWFHKILGVLTCGKLQLTGGKIELFLNTFYGGFKDGTQPGSCDCRCFAGLYFVFRIVLPAITFNQLWHNLYLQQHIFCVSLCLLFAIVCPYRENLYNKIDTTMFGLMAFISILSEYNFHLVKDIKGRDSPTAFVFEMILIGLPLVYITLYLLTKLWIKFIRPKYKQTRAHATFEVSNAAHDLENNDSIMRLIDERSSMFKYASTSPIKGTSRRVEHPSSRSGTHTDEDMRSNGGKTDASNSTKRTSEGSSTPSHSY